MQQTDTAAEYAGRQPAPWGEHLPAQRALRAALNNSALTPLLLCDYDGTLAPFREDKMQAVPFAGVTERLEAIAVGPTRLAFISGRPVAELQQLLPLAAQCEIWGMHGRQRYTPGGGVTLFEPSPTQKAALDAAQQTLSDAGYGPALERKAGSIALHWRDPSALPAGASREQAEQAARRAFSPHQGVDSLALLPFDGGLELRTADRTKAHAAAALLDGEGGEAAVFLGDDVTDEDAFGVLAERGGLGLLVRDEPRSSHAPYYLRPPKELLAFFDLWQDATKNR